MATYSEVPVSFTTADVTFAGPGGGSGTLYTVPAGKYARVTIAVSGNHSVTCGSTLVADNVRTVSWNMLAGETLTASCSAAGTGRARSTAIEYANPA